MDPNTLDRLRSRNETSKYIFLVDFLLNPKLAERIRAVSSHGGFLDHRRGDALGKGISMLLCVSRFRDCALLPCFVLIETDRAAELTEFHINHHG